MTGSKPPSSDPPVSGGWRALLRLLRLLPQGALSRGWGWIARRRLPRALQPRLNRGFARLFGIDPAEAESPPDAYPSLSAFFVRRLRSGVRSWPEHPSIPGSPVDAVLGAFGALDRGTLLQAKGLSYSVERLLADGAEAGRFQSGAYFTLYLSPRHYHRIHAPLSTRLTTARAIPGRLMPVNAPAVRTIPELFPRNERLVTLHEHDRGAVAVVAVGAYNVGSISVEFDPDWQGGSPVGVTNRGARERERRYDPPLHMRRADELMVFHLGSTVVLLLSREDGSLPRIHPSLAAGTELRLGTPLLAEPF